MQLNESQIHIYGEKLIIVPNCRELDSPFSVCESVEIFSTGVSDLTFGRAIVSSLDKGRDDVRSNNEGLGRDEFAKLFGERSIGGFEKRSGKIGVLIHGGQYSITPWFRDGRRGWDGGQTLRIPMDALHEDIARLCRAQLKISLEQSTAAA